MSIYYYTRVAWRYSRCPPDPRALKESSGERGCCCESWKLHHFLHVVCMSIYMQGKGEGLCFCSCTPPPFFPTHAPTQIPHLPLCLARFRISDTPALQLLCHGKNGQSVIILEVAGGSHEGSPFFSLGETLIAKFMPPPPPCQPPSYYALPRRGVRKHIEHLCQLIQRGILGEGGYRDDPGLPSHGSPKAARAALGDPTDAPASSL